MAKKKVSKHPKTCEGCQSKIIECRNNEEDVISCELGHDSEVEEDIGCEDYNS